MRPGVLAGLLVLGACGGCRNIVDDLVTDSRQAELEENRATWTAAGVGTYEYTFTNNCLCPDLIVGPTRIAVQDRVVVELRNLERNQPFEPQEGVRYPTIDELFDLVQQALDDGRPADSLVVEYEPAWGFPTRLYIDWDPGAADEETSYRAGGLAIP